MGEYRFCVHCKHYIYDEYNGEWFCAFAIDGSCVEEKWGKY